MARFETLQRTIQVPDGVTVEVNGKTVKVKGPLGTLQEDLSHLPVEITQSGREVQVSVTWPRKREIGMLGTAAAHVRNMVRGVTKGYRYNLRTVCSLPGHCKGRREGKGAQGRELHRRENAPVRPDT